MSCAADLFADLGFEATTMEAIADRAHTSIGSVYQFFPNKQAVFVAVAEACMETCRGAYFEMLGPSPQVDSWRAVLRRVVDGLARLCAEEATVRAMWRNLHLYETYEAADRALMGEIIAGTAALLGHWFPRLDDERRSLVATLVVETLGTVLFIAWRLHPERAPALIEETKCMLERYLEPLAS